MLEAKVSVTIFVKNDTFNFMTLVLDIDMRYFRRLEGVSYEGSVKISGVCVDLLELN